MVKIVSLAAAVLLLSISVSAADKDCLDCHGSGTDSKAVKVDENSIVSSVHKNLFCADCHDTIYPGKNHRGNKVYACGSCHDSEQKAYLESPHMQGRTANIDQLPTCETCHGGHEILPVDDQYAKTNHRNAVKLCTSCHEDETLQKKSDVLPEPQMIIAYENSVHGKALLIDGNDEAPSCIDCHGSHSFLPSDNPESPVQKTKIAATCGNCHSEIMETYNTSIHGEALAAGVLESPTCTDCHGEHNIKSHFDEESTVYATNVPKTCSECHTSEKVVGKFGLKADRIKTFKESFHGIANEFGEKRAANCASCHGVHNIYKQDNPKSLINKANIENTCGSCHEDLPADFAQGEVHTSADDPESGGKFFVRQFYIIFISLLILGFIIYRVLEYKRRVKRVE